MPYPEELQENSDAVRGDGGARRPPSRRQRATAEGPRRESTAWLLLWAVPSITALWTGSDAAAQGVPAVVRANQPPSQGASVPSQSSPVAPRYAQGYAPDNSPPPPGPQPSGPWRGPGTQEGAPYGLQGDAPLGAPPPRYSPNPTWGPPVPPARVPNAMPFGGQGPVAVPVPVPVPAPPRLQDMSWIYVDSPRPRKLSVHDIVTVIVDEKSEVTQDSRFNRQRNAQMRAQLRQFIRLDSEGRLKPAATDSPTIDAQLRSQMQSFGTAQSREGIKYRIAATVVDILPNGTVVLEARKSIITNRDLWEYHLTGRVRSEDVLGNNTVLSETIENLQIVKREHGKVRDSTKRGWFTTLYDWLLPF